MPDTPISVGFDATSTLGDRTGIGVFAHEMLIRLAADPGLEVTAFAVTWRGRDQLADTVPHGVTVVRRPMAARPLRAIWKHSDHPSLRPWIGRLDLVHGPNFVVPPAGGAAEVATVHDLTPVRHPELCSADTLAYPDLVRRAIRRGAWIHTPSQFVADEVADHFSVDPDRLFSFPQGVTPPPPVTSATDARAGRHLAGAERYLLALGTVEPRKNLPFLVRTFEAVSHDDPDVVLVIAGPDGWGTDALHDAVAHSPVRDRVRRLGWVSHLERAALLRGAQALVYPSRYEGFGLPPLEAMAVGTPAVVSDAGAIPEAVGDAALVVTDGAHDADAYGAALVDVLDDADLRASLIARGRDRAARFTWDRTARNLTDAYRRIVAEHHGR